MALTHCHVIVIGAGIGGLTAALSLQRHGFKVSVYEQASELGEFGAGLLVTPNAMHALEFLGVGEVIAAISNVSNEQLIRHFQSLLGSLHRGGAVGTFHFCNGRRASSPQLGSLYSYRACRRGSYLDRWPRCPLCFSRSVASSHAKAPYKLSGVSNARSS